LIEAEATMVTPTTRLEISKHDSDNRFYECADAAQADYIVTGNTRHFTKPYKNTQIISGRELLELMAAGQEK
jgi:predicted nucleic acid-binding protein